MGEESGKLVHFSNILDKIEFFFTEPNFTTAVGKFVGRHLDVFEFIALDDEQPLQNHEIFSKYTALVERHLEGNYFFILKPSLFNSDCLVSIS